MESSIVNARVPRAKKEAGSGILESLGANVTELVNGAYDYLIAHRQLPSVSDCDAVRDEAGFAAFASGSTLEVDWGADPASVDYRKIIREGKRADYESLA